MVTLPLIKNLRFKLATRVLTISKPYVSASNRKKFEIMAQNPAWEIGLICPAQWSNIKFEAVDPEEDYWIKQLPVVFNGKNHFHFYLGLENAIKEFNPDILNVEEEHYSLVTFQAFRIAKKT